MRYEEIESSLRQIEALKTKGVDQYNKKLIKNKVDVSDLKEHVLDNQRVHRTYFQVSLGLLSSYEEQFEFIEKNETLLQDWWHVDQLTQFIRKPVNFEFALNKAKDYVNSTYPFVRRWGYVLFLTGLQKNTDNTVEILSLMKDDDEYYVQMAEAWLICDLAIYNRDEVRYFLENSKLRYNILGKAIQKMCDSYRTSKQDKEYIKSLRERLRH